MKRVRILIFSLLVGCAGFSAPLSALDSPVAGQGMQGSFMEMLVTSDGPGTHVLEPGMEISPASGSGFAAGFDHSGVARLSSERTDGLFSLCTGSLLSTGFHVLTAGHCLMDSTGTPNILESSLTWELAGETVTMTSDEFSIHPGFTGRANEGFDLGIIHLDEPAHPDIARYDIFRETDGSEGFQPTLRIGYGRPGFGADGTSDPDQQKRWGKNMIESLGIAGLGFTNFETQILSDFDSGEPENDAFQFFFPGFVPVNLGFGPDEVGTAPGDSGGPAFIEDPNNPDNLVIAGVTSYGVRLEKGDGTSSDVDDILNSSWGEFMGDARLGHEEMFGWVDSVIPEPAFVGLVAGAAILGVVLLMRRRRTAGNPNGAVVKKTFAAND